MKLFLTLSALLSSAAAFAQPFWQFNLTPQEMLASVTTRSVTRMSNSDSTYLYGSLLGAPQVPAIYKIGSSEVTALAGVSGMNTVVTGMSRDGKVLVGTAWRNGSTDQDPMLSQGFYMDETGMHLLGFLGGNVAAYDITGVSDDGNTMIGTGVIGGLTAAAGSTFVIDRTTLQLTKLYVDPNNDRSSLCGLSPEGDLVFARAGGPPRYWLKSEGFTICHSLPIPPGSNVVDMIVYGCGSHGRILVGSYSDDAGRHPVRWDRLLGTTTDLLPVADAPPNSNNFTATSCSADGNIIIGTFSNAGQYTFIWTPQTGAVELSKFLTQNGSPPPNLSYIRVGVSFDGTLLCGQISYNFKTLCFYVKLPTPVAKDDFFDVPAELGLQTLPTTGLFANDLNVQNATPTVVDQPQHGTLILGTGGSFKYTPNTGFTGPDGFTYKMANAQFGSLPAQVNLLVYPQYLSSLTLSAPSSAGGKTVQGKATFGIAASAGSLMLTSSRPAAAAVPTSVPVAQGATSVPFQITTGWVLTDSKVTISATFKGLTKSAVLTVVAPKLSTFTLGPASIVGGNNPVGKLTLNGQAADPGATVLMSSSNPAVASVISKTVIPTGATFARFFVYTKGVSAPATATISANYHGIVLTQNVTVNPAGLGALLVKSPSIIGTRLGSFTVALDGFAPPGGAAVSLVSSSASLPVPSVVTVAAGAKSAYFSARAGKVLTDTTVTITGTYHGASKSVVVVLHPG